MGTIFIFHLLAFSFPSPTPEEQARQARVREALAAITARFGAGIVRRGSELEDPNEQTT